MKALEAQLRALKIQAQSYEAEHPYRMRCEAQMQELEKRMEGPVDLPRRDWKPLYPVKKRRRRGL